MVSDCAKRALTVEDDVREIYAFANERDIDLEKVFVDRDFTALD